MPNPTLYFVPDWTDPPVERIEYYTDVIVSANETEQRRRLKTTPRRAVELTIVTTTAQETAELFGVLASSIDGMIHVPQWWHAARITQDATVGGTHLVVEDTTGRDFQRLAWALVWGSNSTWELVDTGNIGSATIVTSGLTLGWTAYRALVVPVMLLRWINRQSFLRVTPSAGVFRLEFEAPNTGLTVSG